MNITELQRSFIEQRIAKALNKGRFDMTKIIKAHKKNKSKAWRRNAKTV